MHGEDGVGRVRVTVFGGVRERFCFRRWDQRFREREKRRVVRVSNVEGAERVWCHFCEACLVVSPLSLALTRVDCTRKDGVVVLHIRPLRREADSVHLLVEELENRGEAEDQLGQNRRRERGALEDRKRRRERRAPPV